MQVPKIPSWSTLAHYGSSRILRSSYFWLIAVPLLAQLLRHVERQFELTLLGNPIVLNLDLPFSWKMFYFGAVAAAIASLVYSTRCPTIIRDYDSYSALRREGRGGPYITRAILEAAAANSLLDSRRNGTLLMRLCREHPTRDFGLERRRGFLGEFLKRYSSNFPAFEADPAEAWILSHQTEIDAANLADAFWYVRDISDRTRPVARFAAVGCYGVAFVLIGVVLAQNFWFVVRFTAGSL